MGRLQGKSVVITGAARGQGATEARLCAAEGAIVHLGDVLDAEGEAVAAEIRAAGGNATYHHLDVSSEADWLRIRDFLGGEDKGVLHGLVNNAGLAFRHSIFDTTVDDWERLQRVNLRGPFIATKLLAPLLCRADGASIVNIGSAAGMTGTFTTAYAMTKWGLRGLTKSTALLLSDAKVRANAVHPGLVLTPIVEADTDFIETYSKLVPLGRPGEIEEIAYIVLFLLSDDSTYLTGADLEADGGLLQSAIYKQIWKGARTEVIPGASDE